MYSLLLIKLLCFLCTLAICQPLKFSSIDTVYQKGVDAYTKERWTECIKQFEDSLHLYSVYNAILFNCKVKCKYETPKIKVEDIEDLKVFNFFLNERQCLVNCQQQQFENVHMYSNVSSTVLEHMQWRKPYGYLHMCYFQMNDLPKAASATYTYLVANPNDEKMKQNIEYYVQQPEVDIKEVINLEHDDYEVLYELGKQAYNKKQWGETVNNMEETITHYLSWESSCRAECDRQPEQEWSPEFTITVSNIIASVLTCRQKCQEHLKPLYNSGVEMLADILNYIQISYYHLDKIDDAAKAVTSYLALYPNDKDMLHNKILYQTLTNEKKFTEISDIIFYLKRDKYEKQLLDFFHNEDNYSSVHTNSI